MKRGSFLEWLLAFTRLFTSLVRRVVGLFTPSVHKHTNYCMQNKQNRAIYFIFLRVIGLKLSLNKLCKKDQMVRYERDQKSRGGHLPSRAEKITLEKRILSNAYETDVASGNHNYALDPMNKVYRGQKHLLAYHITVFLFQPR